MKQKQTFLPFTLVVIFLLVACSSSPQVQAPEGWKQFTGDGFSIYLPATFRGGSDAPDLSAAAEMIRDTGNEFLASTVETSSYLLYALDSSDNFLTSVNILNEQNSVIGDMSLTEYVDLSISNLASVTGFNIKESATANIPGFEAWRIESEIDNMAVFGVPGTTALVQYILKEGNTAWILSYGSPADSFQSHVSDFETSVKTFTLK
jgi:hypothetical protein